MARIGILLVLLVAQDLLSQAVALAIELRPALVTAHLADQLARLSAQAHIVSSFLVLAAILFRHCRWRWLGDFALVYAFTLAVESAGAGFGFLFGSYRFTDMLGIKWFGLVPMLIPLAWFYIAVPSFITASLAFPSRAGRIVGGALLMLAWDLCADPIMGHRYAFWVWREPGRYYGIPLSNFAGWFVLGLLVMAWLERRPWARADRPNAYPFIGHLGITEFTAMGFALIYRMPLAALSCAGLLLCVLCGRRLSDIALTRISAAARMQGS